MPRIVGVDIPAQKRVEAALQYIYGVGPSVASQVLEKAGVNPNKRTHELIDEEIQKITAELAKFATEGDLRREVQANIKRLIQINSYRGIRHRKSLPVRGQRTRTNSRTRKGPKKMPSGGGSSSAAKK